MQQNIEQMENGHIYTRETLPLAAHSRIEEYLRELCLLEGSELPIPQSRIEALLKALITGDYSEIKKPQSRHEGLIYALITGDESHIETCASRIEVLWYMIVKGLSAEELLGTVVNGQLVEDCMSRIESYLWNIAQNGGLGEFVTYQFYEKVKMYNTVARRMKEVKITGDTVVNVVDGDKQLDGDGEGFYELGKFEDKQTYTVINDGSDYTLNGVEYGIGAIETTEDTSTDISVVDIPSGYEVEGFEKFNIQGRTYQNILPDPTLRSGMKNKTMQKFNEGYSNVNVVDGVAKSAILSGKTLVNLVNKSYLIEAGNGNAEKVEDKKLKVTMISSGSKVFAFNLTQKLVQGKKYFVYAPYTVTSSATKKLFVSFYSGTSFAKDMTEYSNYCIINPTDVDLYTKLVIGFHQPFSIGDTFELEYPMLFEYQDGMENWDIPYFTGMTSCEMPVLSSTNGESETIDNGFGVLIPNPAYKSNILSLPSEVVLRSLPSGVCDTYNVVTKEYVQRVEEVVLNGSEDWTLIGSSYQPNDTSLILFDYATKGITGTTILCDKLPVRSSGTASPDISYPSVAMHSTGTNIRLCVKKENASTVTGLKTYLQSNPITVQYQLATSTIKTVDLLSFGNYEKIVLNGGSVETWTLNTNFSDSNLLEFLISKQTELLFTCDKLPLTTNADGERIARLSGTLYLRILKSKLSTLNIDGFKQYLSKNPITVWYKTSTSQSNSIKEMLSFANGHIQLSSGAENSLIPSIDYEVPTSNSYHLDLAKISTKYTMKNMSGTFTVDGTQYNASANGTFTTPSAMTNKLMVTSAIQSNPMILEGDVTSKTLSYFKGIKSAFEDRDKIEVLSLGKNLFDDSVLKDTNFNEFQISKTKAKITVEADTPYYLGLQLTNDVFPNYEFFVLNFQSGNGVTITSKYQNEIMTFTKEQASKINELEIYTNGRHGYGDVYVKHCWLYKGGDMTSTSYEPYKSNSNKIPLLHPLRSLPNGICDEVVVKGSNATIIKRIADDLTELETPVTATVDIEITDQDGNVVDELAFFEHGHIMLNSEIPAALNYLPHATSYKGTIYISSATNKTLYTDDENMMLLYGNQMDKKLPYFKGMNNCQVGNLIISDENSNNVSYDTSIELNKFGTNEDIFDYRTGKLTRHVEVVKLSELVNWQTVTVASQIDTIGFKHILDVTGMSNQTVNSFNDRMSDLKYDDLYITDKEAIAISGDSIYIRINRSRLNGEDVSALTEYLITHDIAVLFNAVESIEQKESFDIVAYEGITNAEVKPITGKLFPSKVIISVPTSNREDVDAIYVNQQSINTNQDNLGNMVINQSNDIEVTTTGIMQINEMIGV